MTDELVNCPVCGTQCVIRHEGGNHYDPADKEAEARVKEYEQRDSVWREKKRVLENDLGKAWEDNKRLKEERDHYRTLWLTVEGERSIGGKDSK